MDGDAKEQLKRLRKALAAISARPPPPPPPPAPPDDHTLFMRAVEGVQPLAFDYFVHPPSRPSPWPLQRWQDEARVMAEAMSDFWPWDELESGEELLYLRPGMRPDTLKRLRRGEWVVQAELDLHGHTVDSGRLAVAEFLQRSRRANQRCVRIIHGKGLGSKQKQPVLKLKLKNWLAQRDEVLAFAQARAVDGGSGAVLALIKGWQER
ncbi:Smr/MutS family protein [Chitiniphilus purpureus]|uniref:Smr/MutS family protein n=1 Tax=Chitiniphilus purpureus TaxID=2981137 RepID=A0ABY6DJ08_9NEIS|nr:Smr/MutS family protein [Chitiniphilus sp. CD1]UXY14330.1 Smr/MutS family protein [Chitiniphilus sp. CD1]